MAFQLRSLQSHGGLPIALRRSRQEMCMRYAVRSSMLLMIVTFTLGSAVGNAQQAAIAPTEIAKDVRTHLMSLPYYGVFDLLTLKVDTNNVVTLAGYVLSDALKKDAEREAR